jgi:hypothetical protein
MTRTRYFAVFVAALCAFLLHAAIPRTPYSSFFVTLTANPPGPGCVNLGANVTLMAAGRFLKPGPKPGVPSPTGLTYAYQARHTWPCQESPFPISSSPPVTWTPTKAGDYQLVVVGTRMVKGFGGVRPETATSDPVPYCVNNPGQTGNWRWSFNPADGSSHPPFVTVTICLPQQQVQGYSYRFKLICLSSAVTCTVQNPLQDVPVNSSSCASWNVGLSGTGRGQVTFQGDVDVIKDCSFVSAQDQKNYNFQ